MWADGELTALFFAENNHIEAYPGGKYEMYFIQENPPGLRGSEGCKVLAVIPGKLFSFTWNAPPQFPEIRNGSWHTWVVLDFEALNENETHVNLTHLGWKEGQEWKKVYEYFENAWEIVLRRFAEACQSRIHSA